MSANTPSERRLAAILAADVVGYSRLMGRDEQGTLDRLKDHRRVLIDPAIAVNRGRIVKTTGDGLLVEFPSVVAAVECAIAIQKSMAERNADLAEENRMRLRIGINLGDIVAEDDDIFGDGVNIAARLQELATPGGVCLSDDAHRQIRGRLAIETIDLGGQRLKNIAEPVHVFALAGLGEKQSAAAAPKDDTPVKPSIAVLPFDNLSADPEQEYFADGMTEDIITELSKLSGLFVIARNSSFFYKKKQFSVRQVGQELSVRYVLEGSVRKAGNRVRINAQLIDAATDHHVWADKIDGELTDVFALQDKVTRQIVQALSVRLSANEHIDRERPETLILEAYNNILRAIQCFFRFTPEDNAQARQLAEAAIALDPCYARAYAVLADCYLQMWHQAWSPDRAATLERAAELAGKALSLDGAEAVAYQALAHVKLWQFRHDEALTDIDRAVALEPNNARFHGIRAVILGWSGRYAEAVAATDHAMQLDPNYGGWLSWAKGHALLLQGRLEEAVEVLRSGIIRQREFKPLHLHLAVALYRLGRIEEARATLAGGAGAAPVKRIDELMGVPYKIPADRAMFEAVFRDLFAAPKSAEGLSRSS